MDDGYIMLSRRFFASEKWQAARAFSDCEAWIDLIQSARFEASPTTSRIGCYEVTWNRGQYPASNRFLAKKWGRSEQWVKSFLGKLKREKMITTDNSQGVNVITLTNYDKYNGGAVVNPPCNPPVNPLNALTDNELQTLATHLLTHLATHLPKQQPTSNPNNKKEEEYKELSNTPNVVLERKKAAEAATLSRKENFGRSLIPYVDKYGKEMIREFFEYWTEMNKSKSKMRFEQQPTWETSKRLATWAKRDKNYAKDTGRHEGRRRSHDVSSDVEKNYNSTF